MDDFEFEVDNDELDEFVRRFGPLLFTNLRNALSIAALLHERKLKDYHRAVPSRSFIARKSPTSPLSTLTGTLLGPASQGRELRGSNTNSLEMIRYIGRGVPYARIHEYGGTIRPRRAKVLTIPTRFQRTQAGDARGRAIHFPGYWRRSKTGRLWFFSKDTNQPLFLGVTRVTIPPRLKFVEFWEQAAGFRAQMYARATREATEGKVYGQANR